MAGAVHQDDPGPQALRVACFGLVEGVQHQGPTSDGPADGPAFFIAVCTFLVYR